MTTAALSLQDALASASSMGISASDIAALFVSKVNAQLQEQRRVLQDYLKEQNKKLNNFAKEAAAAAAAAAIAEAGNVKWEIEHAKKDASDWKPLEDGRYQITMLVRLKEKVPGVQAEQRHDFSVFSIWGHFFMDPQRQSEFQRLLETAATAQDLLLKNAGQISSLPRRQNDLVASMTATRISALGIAENPALNAIAMVEPLPDFVVPVAAIAS